MERYNINPANARNYSNLAFYRSHNPPNPGKGINAPYFAASPMRSPFSRGQIPTNIVFHSECCYAYSELGKSTDSTYVDPKMLRRKSINL